MEKSNTPLEGQMFIPLNMLTSSITSKQIKAYEAQMETYNTLNQDYERMGMGSAPKEPKPPSEEPAYKTIYFNITEVTILNWMESYDETRSHTIIVADLIGPDGVHEQVNLKYTSAEWIKLLGKIGVVHGK